MLDEVISKKSQARCVGIAVVTHIIEDFFTFAWRWPGQNNRLMHVDGTDCAVFQSNTFSKEWFSHKFWTSGLRYKIGVALVGDSIVWVNGPYPMGLIPDQTIFMESLSSYIRSGEKVVADAGYSGNVFHSQDAAGIEFFRLQEYTMSPWTEDSSLSTSYALYIAKIYKFALYASMW